MDLLLGAVPKPAPAASPTVAADGQTLAPLLAEPEPSLEEAGELGVEETAAAPIFAEQESSPAEVVAVEAPVDEVVETVTTAEPAAAPPAPRTRRRRSSRAASTGSTEAASTSSSTELAEVTVEPAPPEAGTAVETSAEPPAARRRRDPDEDLEPAYIPMKITVSIPAVVLSELIRTVQTIRRMTGRRQPVNQGTVIAAALEMAFEEFKTKGATSQLVDKLRIE